MSTHSSILAWRTPWTEEPGRLQSTRSRKVRHDWSDLVHCKVLVNVISKISPKFYIYCPNIFKKRGKTHFVSPPNVQIVQSSTDNKDDMNHSVGIVYSSHKFSHLMFIWIYLMSYFYEFHWKLWIWSW